MALPPGPRTPATLALLQWMIWPAATFEQGFREYGDLYSVKNPLFGAEVIVSDPELIKQIFTGDADALHGGEASRALGPIVGPRSVLLLDGREHHRERKLLMPPFHGERLTVYADVMRSITERVIDAWAIGERFSLLPSMQRITFDVIARTIFGVHEGEEVEGLWKHLGALVEKAQSPLGMLWLHPAFQRDLGPLTGWAAIKRLLRATDEIIYGIIARARESAAEAATATGSDTATGSAAATASATGYAAASATASASVSDSVSAGGSRRSDVLSMLLSAVDEHGQPMSDEELRDELITLLLAGHETTATALCWAVEEILRRPEVHGRILDEIAAAPTDQAHKTALPYLDATIKEVLRLRPLAPLIARKLAAPLTLRGYAIPAGTYVIPCVYLAQRHPDYWDEPAAFRPERFLDKKPDPYAWIPFGGGARRCIGMAFALFEMRVVLATLLPRVRLRLPDKPATITLRSFLFAPSGGPRVIVEERRERAGTSPAAHAHPSAPL
jgi:cytochrome P450